MEPMVSLVIGILGPVGVLLVGQWALRQRLRQRGLPESQENAGPYLKDLILKARLSVVGPLAIGELGVEEVGRILGSALPEAALDRNERRLQSFFRLKAGALRLGYIFKPAPLFILGLLWALVTLVTWPGPELQLVSPGSAQPAAPSTRPESPLSGLRGVELAVPSRVPHTEELRFVRNVALLVLVVASIVIGYLIYSAYQRTVSFVEAAQEPGPW